MSDGRIHVLQLVLQLSLGGAESMVAMLAQHLDPRRFEVEVWALDTGGENHARLARAGVPVDALEKGPGIPPAFARAFRSRLRKERFDLIHAHNFPAARWALIGSVAAGLPTVLVRTEHTYNRAKRAGYLVRHAMSGAWFRAIIGVSEDTTRAHRRLDPLWRNRYVTIPNGIDVAGGRETPQPDRELRKELGLPDEGFVVANLGNLRQPKGQSFLLEAFHRVAAGRPDMHLIIFGEGPLRPDLEAFCRTHGLVERVHLVGHRTDAAEMLAAADLVVQSSVREGMPVSLLEAARVCRPIVATDVGGTREFVRNDRTGLLVPPGSAAELARAMGRILEEPGLSDGLARAARDLLLERHDIRVVTRKTEELYRTVLGERRNVQNGPRGQEPGESSKTSA